MRRLLLIVVLALIGAGGCSYQTAGSPQGGRVVSADFTDVQNLVVGHAVQIAGVRIGTVTGVRVVGSGSDYRARVTMSLRKGIEVPVGTTAQLSITSLLGENYVNLQPPAGLDSGPYLADHAQITSTTVVPAFEQVVGKAGPLLTALSGNDISTIVDAGSTAFGGRGPELQKMIGQTNQLLGLFAAQRAKLDGSVNDLARLGHDLAKGQDELSKLPASLAQTTKVLSDERYQLLDTISKITALARTTNDTVLVGRTDELRRMITELGPVISTLASDKTNLGGLITNMQAFVEKVPRAVYNGQLLLYPILNLSTGSGSGSGSGSTKQAANVLATLTALMGGRK
jgi:phospholipid/cholesterol/gamma-HCH transport system substrate-binding protein